MKTDFDKEMQDLQNILDNTKIELKKNKPRKEKVYIVKTVEKVVVVKRDRTKLPITTKAKPLF